MPFNNPGDAREQLQAHRHCFQNEEEIKASKVAMCLSCQQRFETSSVTGFVFDGDLKTALCPNCGGDTLVTEEVFNSLSEKGKKGLLEIPKTHGTLSHRDVTLHENLMDQYRVEEARRCRDRIYAMSSKRSFTDEEIAELERSSAMVLKHLDDPVGQNFLGDIYSFSAYGRMDTGKAFYYYYSGALMNDPRAQLRLGQLCLDSDNVSRALAFFTECITQQSDAKDEALLGISDIFREGGDSIIKNPLKALGLAQNVYTSQSKLLSTNRYHLLADAALRIAELYSSEYVPGREYTCLYFATIAKQAALDRWDDDGKGENGIIKRAQSLIDECTPKIPLDVLDKDRKGIRFSSGLDDLICCILAPRTFTIDHVIAGHSMSGRYVDIILSADGGRAYLALPVPDGYCRQVKKLKIRLHNFIITGDTPKEWEFASGKVVYAGFEEALDHCKLMLMGSSSFDVMEILGQKYEGITIEQIHEYTPKTKKTENK